MWHTEPGVSKTCSMTPDEIRVEAAKRVQRDVDILLKALDVKPSPDAIFETCMRCFLHYCHDIEAEHTTFEASASSVGDADDESRH